MLWAGQTVSQIGSQVTTVALPLVAVTVLGAGPGEMGLLNAAGYLPALLLTLLAGVWADRSRRRPLMVGADLGRAVVIGLIPAAALAGLLGIETLYGIALAAGALTVLFDVSYHVYVPSLAPPGGLVKANGRLQFSASFAQLAGPGLGGLLVQLLTAPVTMAVDAGSFLLSAAALLLVRRRESPPAAERGRSLGREMREGLRATFLNRHVRPVALEAATFNFFGQFVAALYVIYVVKDVGLSAGVIGAIASTAAIGAMLGALAAEPLTRRLGFGPAIIVTMVTASTPLVIVPLAAGPTPLVIGLLCLAYLVEGFGLAASAAQAVALRQLAVPPEVIGRANASYRTLSFGVLPLGALAGGFLGEALGARTALLIGALGLATAPLWVIASPVRGLRRAEDARPVAAPTAHDDVVTTNTP